MKIFQKNIEVRWSDIDANMHVTHTSYADFATHTRSAWLQSIGYPMQHLMQLDCSAVLLKESTEYYKELFFGESVTVELFFAGSSEDYSRWKFIHHIYKEDKTLSAINIIYGAWISTKLRKITTPPAKLIEIITTLPKTSDFEIILNRKG